MTSMNPIPWDPWSYSADLDYKTTEYDEEADADRVKWVPLRDDTGALFNKYKYSGKGPKAIRNVRVPIPDENGNLQPVGWTMRNVNGTSSPGSTGSHGR